MVMGNQDYESATSADEEQPYAIQPDQLRKFAKKLQAKAEVLNQRAGDLDVIDFLADDRLVMGNFPEAFALADLSKQAVAVTDELAKRIGEVVAFADKVGNDSATAFENVDVEAAGSYLAKSKEVEGIIQKCGVQP
jgi:hypothetical protein